MSRLRDRHPRVRVDELCGLFGYTRQAYYQGFRRGYESSAAIDQTLDTVEKIRKKHPKMGVRKLKVVLARDYGIDVGRDSLFDIMRNAGLLMCKRMRHRRTTFSGHGMRTYPNLIKEIVPSRPDEIWVTDITYLHVEGRHMYVFLVTDMYSRMAVGWKVADNMRDDNAIEALKMALRGMNPQYKEMPVIHHSDRGSQYCSLDYVKLMKKHSMEISMTEGGNPRENSVAERVNGIIKNEYLYPLQVSISGLHMRVHRAIHAYNAERPHLSLNMHTPEYVYRTGILTHRLWKNYYPYYDSLNHL